MIVDIISNKSELKKINQWIKHLYPLPLLWECNGEEFDEWDMNEYDDEYFPMLMIIKNERLEPTITFLTKDDAKIFSTWMSMANS
ncbi:MAG: hypothetical protein WC284_03770 [Candidimonas sp.]